MPNKKRKDLLSFPGKDSTSEKHGFFFFFFHYSPPSFHFYSTKSSLSLAVRELANGSPWLQTLNCTFLLTPNKPIFAGEIAGRLF